MKKLLILIAIVGAASYMFQQRPAAITNPTYAEIRMNLDAGSRSFEQLVLIKAIDEADCRKHATQLIDEFQAEQASDSGGRWVLKSSECKAELPARLAKLFENEPTFVTYLSLASGARKERETRLIYWGVSTEESDRVCNGVSKTQSSRKGAVTCIRSIR